MTLPLACRAEYMFPQPLAASRNDPNPHKSDATPGLWCRCRCRAVQNKGFRNHRLDHIMAQTHTGTIKRQDCGAVAVAVPCRINVSAVIGWIRELPKPTQEQGSTRTKMTLSLP